MNLLSPIPSLPEIIDMAGDARQGETITVPVISGSHAAEIHRQLKLAWPYSRFIVTSSRSGDDLTCYITIAYHST